MNTTSIHQLQNGRRGPSTLPTWFGLVANYAPAIEKSDMVGSG